MGENDLDLDKPPSHRKPDGNFFYTHNILRFLDAGFAGVGVILVAIHLFTVIDQFGYTAADPLVLVSSSAYKYEEEIILINFCCLDFVINIFRQEEQKKIGEYCFFACKIKRVLHDWRDEREIFN